MKEYINETNKFLSQNILYLIDFMIRKNYIAVVNLLLKSLVSENIKKTLN